MQTSIQRIRRVVVSFVQRYHDLLIHVLKSVGVILAIAFFLEVFLFNMNHWISLGYDPVNLSSSMGITKNADKTYTLSEANHVIEFKNLNKDVHNVRIEFDSGQDAQDVGVKVQFTDSAHETYFDDTEYARGIPVRQVATNSGDTQYIKLETTGITNNLRLEITGKDVTYPIKIRSVYINNVYPFRFLTIRFLIAAGVMGLVYLFRPKSLIYQYRLVRRPRASKLCIGCAAFIEICLVSAFLFMGSNQVGIATPTYNSGSWDQKSVVNSFPVGGRNSQQYQDLARAMASGHLYLDETPPDWLTQMKNPYDRGARDELQKETGQEYMWDTAYYQGHYYVYFGVVPVLVFYLPCWMLTHTNFPTAIGVLIACIAYILGVTALLDRFARHHFQRVSLGMYLLLQLPLVFCSGILYLVKFPTFYSLPIMMALAFSVWGLYMWMRGRRQEHPCGWYLGGSLCMALVVGCRPQIVLLSLVAFPLFWRRYITQGRIKTRQGAKEFACLIAPYIVVLAFIMWYNVARFGSPLNFGSNYNLTTNDMTQRGMNAGRILPALFAYFLQTPSTTGVFPYIQPVTFDTTFMGQTIAEVTFGGIFACLPILWAVAFTPSAIKMRIKQRQTHTVAGVVGVLTAVGILVAVADAEMAGILQRYYADFTFMFLLVAILGIFIVNENLEKEPTGADVLIKALPVLVAVSLVYSVLLCLVAETGWYSDAYPWAYRGIIHMFQFWT